MLLNVMGRTPMRQRYSWRSLPNQAPQAFADIVPRVLTSQHRVAVVTVLL